jgi:hypothetical protein
LKGAPIHDDVTATAATTVATTPLWVNADGSTSTVGCATAEVPADHGLVLELAARCLAIALVRGYAGARELSDLLAAARVRLPLLNWPTSALQPLTWSRDDPARDAVR